MTNHFLIAYIEKQMHRLALSLLLSLDKLYIRLSFDISANCLPITHDR